MAAEKILVCGGAGYIGSHTCKALAEAGFRPVVVDNLSTGHASFVRWGPLINADIRNARAACETIRTHGITPSSTSRPAPMLANRSTTR